MNVNEEDFPEIYRPIIRRLHMAAEDEQIQMKMEDDYWKEIQDRERDLAQAKKVIDETKQALDEKDKVIEETKQALEKKDKALEPELDSNTRFKQIYSY
jgi:predicted  nucleic acid-binding Zn-ribbon protein